MGNNGGHGNAARAAKARLEDVAETTRGRLSNGSTAATDDAALLNPEFSRWLQGLPPIQSDYAVMATAYASLLPPSSSPRISIVRRIPDLSVARMKRWREAIARPDGWRQVRPGDDHYERAMEWKQLGEGSSQIREVAGAEAIWFLAATSAIRWGSQEISMGRTFFIADTHFGHQAVITFAAKAVRASGRGHDRGPGTASQLLLP